MHYTEHDWINFFEKAGISAGLCRRYAEAFSLHHMTPDILPLLTIATLREMGIYPVGDCMQILQYRDRLCHLESFNTQARSEMAFGPSPTAVAAAAQQQFKVTSAAAFSRRVAATEKNTDLHPGVRMFQLSVNEVQRQMNQERVPQTSLRSNQGLRFQEGAVSSTSDIPKAGRGLAIGKRPSVFERLGNVGRPGGVRSKVMRPTGKASVFSRITYRSGRGVRPSVFQRLGPRRPRF